MRPKTPQPEMNVTPLVDVVLVLLIIFMVIVPQMAAGAAVDVPAAMFADPSKPKVKPLTVSVTSSGVVFIEKARVADSKLGSELAAIKAKDPHRRVRIKADKAAAYGHVRRAFAACQNAGFPGVALQVGDRERKGQ